MTFKVRLLRADDLLNLEVEAVNLRVDPEPADAPALVVDDAAQPALLVFTFPPQSTAERAWFNDGSLTNYWRRRQQPEPPKPRDPPEPFTPPGVGDPEHPLVAMLARPSRLVFEVPADARIPFTTEGLLDWTGLNLRVSAIAAIGREPTQTEIDAAPKIAEPALTETAIEMPYRLLISPTREVGWAHRVEPFTSRGRTELWHTRLQLRTIDGAAELSDKQRAPLRAIWSPDYRENGQPPATDQDLGPYTAMTPRDRHEIVNLTSAFHGFELPPLFAGGLLGAIRLFPRDYVPVPFEVEQLMLSPLGGWLRSQGDWPKEPPRRKKRGRFRPLDPGAIFANLGRVALRPELVDLRILGPIIEPLLPIEVPPTEPGGDQLSISQWVHIATQGRDHYVRIVKEGILLPLFNRAAEITETTREFHEIGGGLVVAYQIQRIHLEIREPVKHFPETDRAMTYKRVELTTTVTPFLAPPQKIGVTQAYWVEVSAGKPKQEAFRFNAIGSDLAGDKSDTSYAMIFVPLGDLDESRQPPKAVRDAYNNASEDRRTSPLPGQRVTFAEAAPDSDNTRLVTRSLTWMLLPDRPQMLKARVKVPQVEELLGTDQPTTIRFFGDYVKNGFDAATGVFAEIVKPSVSPANPFDPAMAETLGVNFSADQAGGIATPNLGVSTLSRALGPLAGRAADAVTGTFDPTSFFPKGTAQLFGSFDLVDLIVSGTLEKNAPKLTTSVVPGGPPTLVAQIEWEPEVQSVDLGVAAFTRNAGTRLEIRGRIEKPILPPVGPPPPVDVSKSDFNGKLTDFSVSVLKSVEVRFDEFSFQARSGQKTEVGVALKTDQPIKFTGDLEFVEELRQAIPPGLFGKGASLDVSPAGVRAGFAVALPPISVGVFSLRDVSLGAALTLPFLDGKPLFEFNVSEKARPFLLSVAIFGGGGFFNLQLDTAGIRGLMAALEFGATAALDIGVASGEVHIMAGIYYSMQRKEGSTDFACTLSGYLRAGGSMQVLGIIEISVEFVLSFTYDSGTEKAYGKATLTVKISIAFFSVSVDLTVERGFGGQNGDPTFGELYDAPEMWSDYALAFA